MYTRISSYTLILGSVKDFGVYRNQNNVIRRDLQEILKQWDPSLDRVITEFEL